MDAIKKFWEEISVLDSTSLRFRPKPEVQVAMGSVLAESFEAMSALDRNSVRQSTSESLKKKLVSLSGYLSEVAINARRPDLIRVCLILQAIEDFQWDYRENIRRLVLIAFAARKLDVALDPIIASISDLVSENAKEHLQGLAWSAHSLSSFGIQVDDTPGAFRFVPAP